MNWISSIKDKSSKFASYVTGNNTQETTDESMNKSEQVERKKSGGSGIELKGKGGSLKYENKERNDQPLLEAVRSFFPNKIIYGNKVEDAADMILQNPEKYLRKDPVELKLPEREDFKNFSVFYEQNHENHDLLAKVFAFDATLPQLMITDEHLGHEKKDSIVRFMMRFVYAVIYLTDSGSAERERKASLKKTDVDIENKENETLNLKEKGKSNSDKNGTDNQDKVELVDCK